MATFNQDECFMKNVSTNMGPSIKDVRSRGGRGVSQKRTHADAGGRGGQWPKADVLKFKFLPKF